MPDRNLRRQVTRTTRRSIAAAACLLAIALAAAAVPAAAQSPSPEDTTGQWMGKITVVATNTQASSWTAEEKASYTVRGDVVHWTASTRGSGSWDECAHSVAGSGTGNLGSLSVSFGQRGDDGTYDLDRYTLQVDSDEAYKIVYTFPCSGTQDDTNDAQGAPSYEDIGDPPVYFDAPPAGPASQRLADSYRDVRSSAPGSTDVLEVTWDLTRCGTACQTKCDNGLDDDGDGRADYGADPGCSDWLDQSELGLTRCDNGKDDDGDGRTDYKSDGRGDPGCVSPEDEDESLNVAKCRDGLDNDNDGRIDAGADPGCASAEDNDELGSAACDNGADDDRDGPVDMRDDGCKSLTDDDEQRTCRLDGSKGEARPAYHARVANAGPDVHLFDFTGFVAFCFDGKDSEVLYASAFGSVDGGWIKFGALENLGLTFEALPAEAFTVGPRATLRGEFEVHAHPASFIGRGLGIAAKAAAKRAERAMASAVKRRNVARWAAAVDRATRDLQWAVARRLEKAEDKVDFYVGDDSLAAWINGRLRDFAKPLLAKIDAVGSRVREPDAFAWSADAAAEKWGEGIGVVLDQLGVVWRFNAWSPAVELTTFPDGNVLTTESGIANPFLAVTEVSPAVRYRDAATRAAADATGDLDRSGLRRRRGDRVGIDALPGTTSISLTAAAGTTARAARRRVLASGRLKVRKAGMRRIRVKPTAYGRRILRRGALLADVRVTTKPPGGARHRATTWVLLD